MSIVVEALNRLHESTGRDRAAASVIVPEAVGGRPPARPLLLAACGLVAVSVSAFWLLPPDALTTVRRSLAHLTPGAPAPPSRPAPAPSAVAAPVPAPASSGPPAAAATTPRAVGPSATPTDSPPQDASLRARVATGRPALPSGEVVPAESRATLQALERDLAERLAARRISETPGPGSAPAPRALAPAVASSAVVPPPPPAVEHDATAGDQKPEAFRSAFRLGVLHQQAGDHRGAVAQYRRQLALDERSVATLNNLAVSLRHLGELAEAAEVLQRAVAIDPVYDKALTNLGVVEQLRNRSEAAMDAHLRALAVNARSWESALNLGLLLWEAGDLERAAHFFSTAIAIRPLPVASYHLALIAERQGNTAEAVRRLQEVVRAPHRGHAALRAEAEVRLRALIRGNL